jgi:hypothetical protein
MTAAIIQAAGCGVGATAQVRGLMWFAFWMNAAWATSLTVCVYELAGRFGATALSLANCLAYLVLLLGQVRKFRHDLPPHMSGRIHCTLILVSIVTVIALWTDTGHLTFARSVLAIFLATAVGAAARVPANPTIVSPRVPEPVY